MDRKLVEAKMIAAAIARRERLMTNKAFDPLYPDSRPTDAQQQVFDDFGKIHKQFIVAGNQSGKSQVCSRLISWMFTETHPNWKRPETWKDEPLFILVLGRNGKQIEESLLPKLRSYMEEGSYKEVRIGNIIQKLEHKNGNRIVFQSLENPSVARERIQSYVCHLVWQDEMPPDLFIIDESFRRLQARDGYYLASFTPLVVNKEIQQLVDGSDGMSAKKYQFNMLDNPLYQDPKRKEQLLQELSQFPESVRNTRLYGHWSSPDNAVYQFNRSTMIQDPVNYSRGWRHVESSDPATESKFGFTLWAEDPSTGVWYLVRADYINGIYVPEKIYEEVMKRTTGFNIVRRIADPAATWYINTARGHQINYVTPYSKNNRKAELIKNLQNALGVGEVKIASWCHDFIDEIEECQWSDSVNNRIVNASKYHLLDSAQYFTDLKPKGELVKQEVPWYTQAKLDLQKRVQKKAEEKKRIEMKLQRRRRRWPSFTL